MEAPERSFAAMEGCGVPLRLYMEHHLVNTRLPSFPCFLLFPRALFFLGSVTPLHEIVFCLHWSGKASVVCSQEFQLAQTSLKSAIPTFPLQITSSYCKSYQLKNLENINKKHRNPVTHRETQFKNKWKHFLMRTLPNFFPGHTKILFLYKKCYTGQQTCLSFACSWTSSIALLLHMKVNTDQ